MLRTNLCAVFVLIVLLTTCEARTIIVAADSSGDYANLSAAAEVAEPGDSIMVRNGTYTTAYLSIDSAVVLFAEHPGEAIVICAMAIGVILHQSAQVIGMQFVGDFPPEIWQYMLEVHGGPATIYNCQFLPTARQGVQLSLYSAGVAPVIGYCQFFTQSGASPVVHNFDTTTVWMPYNYFQRTDTVAIHRDIWDSSNGLGHGHVYITPVLDSFQWLAAEERPSISPAVPSIHVYPNPSFDGRLQVNPISQMPIQSVEVFNLLGQRVWSLNTGRSVYSHPLTLELPMSSGTYFLTVKQRDVRQTVRFGIIR